MISVDTIYIKIQKELGSLFSTEQHSNSDILDYISSAIRYITNYGDYDFLKKPLTVVVTTPNIEVITAVKIKTHYVYFGGVEKIPLSLTEWYRPDITNDYVMSFEDKFIAKEAGTYTVLASVVPNFPSLQTDIIDLPSNLQDVVVGIALHYGYMQSQMYDRAGEKLGIANAILKTFTNRTENRTPQHPASMPRNNPI